MNFRNNFIHSESCWIQWNHPFCSISRIYGVLAFSVDPPKNLYFLCNSFSLNHTENMITDSSISWKNKYFLFKPFLSQVNNIFFSIYVSTSILRPVGISPVFREAIYSSWRGWARLLLHCLRSIAQNSSGPPEEFCEIVFIASMISSLVILMSDSVFPCGCPKKSFGYSIVIVGSGVLKTLLYC